jgi:MFS family permease
MIAQGRLKSEQPSLLAPLRHQEYRWLWLGQGLAVCAQSAIPVALVFYILSDVDGALAYGLIVGSMSAMTLCMILVGGVVADRFRRSRVIMGANLLRAVGTAGLAVLGPGSPLVVLIMLAMTVGAGTAFHQPAQRALVPDLVDKSEIRAANALQQVTGRAAMILGPVAGGAGAVMFGAEGVFWASAAVFAASALSPAWIGDARIAPKEQLPVWRSAREGLSVVVRTRWLGAVISSGFVQVLFTVAPVMVLLPVILTENGQQEHYGLLLSCYAVGSVAGAVLASRWAPHSPGIPALLGPALMAGQILCLLYGAPPLLLGLAMIATGFGTSLFIVYWVSGIQTGVPRELRSRVFSLDSVGANALQPLALAATVPVAGFVGTGTVLAVALMALIATSLMPLVLAEVRRLGAIPEGGGEADVQRAE